MGVGNWHVIGVYELPFICSYVRQVAILCWTVLCWTVLYSTGLYWTRL